MRTLRPVIVNNYVIRFSKNLWRNQNADEIMKQQSNYSNMKCMKWRTCRLLIGSIAVATRVRIQQLSNLHRPHVSNF